MEYLNKITDDIKDAMKKGEKEKLSALRMLKSSLIENKTAASPRPELDVITSHCKKLQSSIDVFPAGDPNRAQLTKEIEFLKPYLPEQMSADEVKAIIQGIKAKLPSPNMGMIMKELSPQIKGKFDGKLANQLVQEALK